MGKFAVIVDSSRIDNIVSKEMVDKKKLKRNKHHFIYWVSWLKKEHHLLVNEKSLVSFQIRNYKDEIMCDVILMDKWHILLGRSWQFDRQVVHNGKLNTYTIHRDDEEYTLTPMKNREEESEEKSKVSLLFRNLFLRELKKEKALFPVVPKLLAVETMKKEEEIPMEV